jgi:hypothetical protein
MADISGVVSIVAGVPVVKWTGVSTSTDTPLKLTVAEGSIASVLISGTFGSATAKLQFSNDGTTWTDLKDSAGTALSVTSTTQFQQVGVYAVYIKPVVSGGSGDNIDFTVTLRRA